MLIRKLFRWLVRIRKIDITKREQMILLLKKAGWYEGRFVDISNFDIRCKAKGIELFDSAKKFLQEFSGIKSVVYFKELSNYNNTIGRYSYYFNFVVDAEEKVSKDYYEVLLEYAGEDCFCIGESGFYYPGIIAIGRSGKIYFIHDWDESITVYKFNSLIESMEHELKQHEIIISSLYEND